MRHLTRTCCFLSLVVYQALAQEFSDASLLQGDSATSSDVSPSAADSTPRPDRPPSDNAFPAASPGTGDDGHRDGLLNYYFLIIGVFIIVLLLLYYSLARRRRLARMQSRSHQTDALSQDLTHPSSHQAGFGRWRRWRPGAGSRDMTHGPISEGLNERGEAPPPYVKEPERVHISSRGSHSTGDMEMGDWSSHTAKPPEYSDNRTARAG